MVLSLSPACSALIYIRHRSRDIKSVHGVTLMYIAAILDEMGGKRTLPIRY